MTPVLIIEKKLSLHNRLQLQGQRLTVLMVKIWAYFAKESDIEASKCRKYRKFLSSKAGCTKSLTKYPRQHGMILKESTVYADSECECVSLSQCERIASTSSGVREDIKLVSLKMKGNNQRER